MKKIKLNQDKIFMTQGIRDVIAKDILNHLFLIVILDRFVKCDFSEMKHEEDIKMNMDAVEREDGRVLAEYSLGEDKIWICHYFGEHGYTTIMLPSEY